MSSVPFGGGVGAVELRTLGECQVVVADGPIGPQSPHMFALSLYLCVERGRTHTRDELVPIFFPGTTAEKAAHSLRQTIYKLRKTGLPCETTQAGTIVPSAAVRDDFSSLRNARQLPELPGGRLPGEFLPGYWPKISPAFTQWLEAQRDAVNGALRRAYIVQIEDRRSVGRWDQVEKYARACLKIDPLNEEATLALAESLALTGSKAAALKLLDEFIHEVGTLGTVITLPAATLRRRISERLTDCRSDWLGQMVGRETEIRAIGERLRTAVAGRSEAIWISGEPGIGKTRLLHEVIRLAQLAGARVVIKSCQPHDSRRAFGVFADLSAPLLSLPGALGCSPATAAFLRQFQGGRSEGTPIPPSEPAAAAQASHLLSDLFDSVASETPLIIAVDDAQWMDRISEQVLADLIGERTTRRILFLVSSRQVCQSGNWLGRLPAQLILEGLSAEASSRYVRELASLLGTSLSNVAVDRAVSLAAGNPLFLRYLAEHYAHEHNAEALPTELHAALEHRVKTISPTASAILCACALLGSHATVQLVTASLQIPAYELALELGKLETQRLISLIDGRITSTHALLTEATIAAHPAASLAVIRRSVASVLENQARLTEDRGLLWAAYEGWIQAGDDERAADCLRECARRVARLGLLDFVLRTLDVVVREEPIDLEATLIRAAERQVPLRPDKRNPATGRLRAAAVRARSDDLRIEVARWMNTNAGQPKHSGWLLTVLRDEGQSPAARLKAAAVLVSLAELTVDATLAHTAFENAISVQELTDADNADLTRLRLSYHTVFGDQTEAVRIASVIARIPMDLTPGRQSFRNGINASEALARCNLMRQSLLLAERVYSAAETSGDLAAGNSISTRASWNARQIGDEAGARSWRRRRQEPASSSFPERSGFLYNEALFALDEGRFGDARSIAALLEQRLPAPLGYQQSLICALKLRCQAEESPTEIDESVLDRCKAWSLRTAALVPQDDVALSVMRAMQVAGATAAGRTYLATYMAKRRNDGFAPLPILTSLHNHIDGKCGNVAPAVSG